MSRQLGRSPASGRREVTGTVRQGRQKRRRVVHVFKILDAGGAELRTLETLEHLDTDEFDTHFILMSGRRGTQAARAEAAGAHVAPMTLNLKFPFKFVHYLRRHRVDVLHSHVATFSGFIQILARLAGVGTRISHLRSDGDGQGNGALRRGQRKVARLLLAHLSTNVVGVTPAALEFGLGRPPGPDCRGLVIPNGIDVAGLPEADERDRWRSHYNVRPEQLLVLNVGRAAAAKNRSRAIEVGAMAAMAPDVVVALVGDMTPAEYRLADQAAQSCTVPGSIEVWGFLPQLAEALLAADVLLVTSLREGLPGVVLQALAVGTPVVSSDLSGCAFIQEHVRFGITLLPHNRPDVEWANALVTWAREGRDAGRRAHLRTIFATSPFVLSESAGSLARLWRGEADG